jgi:hypothetical protein
MLALLIILSLVSVVQGQIVSKKTATGALTLTIDGAELLTYQSKPNPTKVYVSRLLTPKGVQVLRDSPHDHVHHHALMYAIGIDDVDFWSEVPADKFGRQRPTDLSSSQSVDDQGRGHWAMHQSVDWVSPTGDVLAREDRQIRALPNAVPEASLITWQMTLRPPADKDSVKLWGRHYFGLGMRFAPSMDEGSRLLFPPGVEGAAVRGAERLTDAKWCAVQGHVDGQPVTVAMFDSPENKPRSVSWFTMDTPFTYLAATLKLHEEPLQITKNEPLRLRYAIVAWDGQIGGDSIEQAYQICRKFPP